MRKPLLLAAAVMIAAAALVSLRVSGVRGPGQTAAVPASAPAPTPAPASGPAVAAPGPAPAVPAQAAGTVRLLFAGDVMLDRTPGEAVAQGGDPFGALAAVLGDADLVVGNLECPVATQGPRIAKLYNFRCHPRVVPLLAQHFDAVSVANNHAGDSGQEGFLEQLGLLEEGGLAYFGGGRNAREAHAPLLLQAGGLRVALLGYNEVELRSYEAGPESPGLAWSEDGQVEADIRTARSEADLVIVYPHWGLEYHREPSDRQRSLARRMIDAGADLVVGSHPHVTQTAEHYKGRLILYSLGNFVFDDFRDVPPELNEPSRTSWMLRVEVAGGQVRSWETLTVRTDDAGFPQPVPDVLSPCASAMTAEVRLCSPGFGAAAADGAD